MAARPCGDPAGNPATHFENSSPTSEFTIVTRGSKRRRNGGKKGTATDSTASFVFAGHDHEGDSNLNELARLIATLKDTITKQSSIIETVRADLTAVKSEQQDLKNQNAQLQEEIRSLQTQLSAYSASIPTPRSWASVAASPSGSGSGSGSGSAVSLTGNSNATTEKTQKEPTVLRISTQPRSDNADNAVFERYLPIESASSHIRNALSNASSTKDVQVAGVGTTKTGYVIRFKDQQSTDTARTNREWLETLGGGTKLVKPRYGVVVHRVPTADFSIPENQREGIRKIMEENDLAASGFEIEEIAWLKRPDKPLGMSASMGIWLNTSDAAEWIVNNGLVFGERYVGSAEHYQVKRKRCHRCQRFGHLAWSCNERARCGHCAGEHERRNCVSGVSARCLDCNGAYLTGDRNCQGPAGLLSSQ